MPEVRSRWRVHRGCAVLFSDYSGFGTDARALAKEVAHSELLSFSRPDGSVLNLVDVEGSVGTKEAVAILKKSASDTRHKTRRIAVLGVTGVKKFLADGIARFTGQEMRYFDAEEEALDWLVEGADRAAGGPGRRPGEGDVP